MYPTHGTSPALPASSSSDSLHSGTSLAKPHGQKLAFNTRLALVACQCPALAGMFRSFRRSAMASKAKPLLSEFANSGNRPAPPASLQKASGPRIPFSVRFRTLTGSAEFQHQGLFLKFRENRNHAAHGLAVRISVVANSGSLALTRENPLLRRCRIGHSIHILSRAARSYFSQITSFTPSL
jgi:hypothetical protein